MQKRSSIKGIVVLLAAAMATPMLLTAWMLFMQARIRHEMLEKLEKENLETLILRRDQIQWKEKGKELLIDGQLFDVFSMTPTTAGYQVRGLWDRAETALKNKLDHTLEHQQERREQGSLIYALIMGIIFYPLAEPTDALPPLSIDPPGYKICHTDLPPSPYPTEQAIPPDFC
jgi:hypothetical protein